jgi:predicted PurR-regulated permease PerM
LEVGELFYLGLMGNRSMIPFVGTAFAVLPYFITAVTGNTQAAMGLLVYGGVVVVDHQIIYLDCSKKISRHTLLL